MRREFQGAIREGRVPSEGGGMPLEPPGLTSIFEGQPQNQGLNSTQNKGQFESFEVDNEEKIHSNFKV